MNSATESQLNPTVSSGHCEYQPMIDGMRCALNRTLKGKDGVVEQVIACVLAKGHILLEDLPGLGKTTLAKSLSRAIGGEFARVQCTPDLMPSDVTGFNMYNQKTREFDFIPGPVFSDVLLADEINRATPRTQSSLFEAMAERQVTIDKHCHRLAESFLVIATQNPVDSHGAYPLPEAQLDRFAMRLSIGYPGKEDEMEMLAASIGPTNESREEKDAILTPSQLNQLQNHVAHVHVEKNLLRYLVELAEYTRQRPEIVLGVSPRGLLTLQRVSQAWAHLQGRDFVIPDDIQEMAYPVLNVRLAGEFDDARNFIEEMLSRVPVPVTRG